MKQFSLALNILLVIAVGILFYLHFSSTKSPVKTATTTAASPSKDSCAIGHIMAFVELDSLYDNVEYIKQKQKELEAEQDRLGKKYQGDYVQLENEKNDFIKKNQSPSQQQVEEFQATLYKKQQAIENDKQNQAQNLAAIRTRTMEDIQSKLRKFLDEFNADRRYSYIFATGTGLDYILYKDAAHNITGEVIKGLTKEFEKKGK